MVAKFPFPYCDLPGFCTELLHSGLIVAHRNQNVQEKSDLLEKTKQCCPSPELDCPLKNTKYLLGEHCNSCIFLLNERLLGLCGVSSLKMHYSKEAGFLHCATEVYQEGATSVSVS